MGVAEGVVAVVLEVGFPEVVDGAALGSRGRMPAASMASRPRRLWAKYQVSQSVETVCSQCRRADARAAPVSSKPATLALAARSRIEAVNRFQSPGAIGAEVGEGAFAEGLAGKEVAHDLGESLEGQQLVVAGDRRPRS